MKKDCEKEHLIYDNENWLTVIFNKERKIEFHPNNASESLWLAFGTKKNRIYATNIVKFHGGLT